MHQISFKHLKYKWKPTFEKIYPYRHIIMHNRMHQYTTANIGTPKTKTVNSPKNNTHRIRPIPKAHRTTHSSN